MDTQIQYAMMMLAVGWTLVGAFIFTVVITLLSMVGAVKFADKKQQNKLFYVLIVQLVVGCVGFFLGIFPTPGATVKKAQEPVKKEVAQLAQANTSLIAERDTLTGSLDAAKNQLTEATTQLAEAKIKSTTFQEEIAQTKTVIEDQNKTLERLKDVSQPAAVQLPVTDHTQEIVELQKRAEKAETELAEAKQIQETLNAKLKDNRSLMAALDQSRRTRNLVQRRQRITGRVLAVDQRWNFLVLNIGNKQGVTVDAMLLIMRGGELIGKARITSIEPSKSIADVVPGSLRHGSTVQSGDSVVFEGRRDQQISMPLSATSSAKPESAPLPSRNN